MGIGWEEVMVRNGGRSLGKTHGQREGHQASHLDGWEAQDNGHTTEVVVDASWSSDIPVVLKTLVAAMLVWI